MKTRVNWHSCQTTETSPGGAYSNQINGGCFHAESALRLKAGFSAAMKLVNRII